ncbi:MAG: flavocytochrome c, partial [Oscillospiraceae bacterium]
GASGQEIIKKQLAKAEELGIKVLYNTPATELITDANGKVVGVKASSEDTNYTFKTNKSVIITTGGFGSNIEMRKQYNPAIDEHILSTNSVGSTGDGIVMAQAVGADVTGMEYIQTYPICDPLTGTLLYFDDARLYGHTVIVNKEGKRFVEELGRRDEMSMAIKAQTDSVCYELIDQNGFEQSKLQENHAKELEYLYKNNLLVKADTLEEVAAGFGVDAAELKKTVDNYNGYVDAGKDTEFNKRSLPSKIEKGPYYMIKAVPAVHHTMGGVKINTDAQVLNKDGKAIEGLYAAGEVTGGIHGTNRLGSDALADITVFGRIAGKNAAK